MKKASCCSTKSQPQYSYAVALGVLLLGYTSNYLAALIQHVSLNLLYWWSTAFLVLASFQISPKRFFRYDRAVRSAFVVPISVMIVCFLPLQVMPQLIQFFLWRMLLGYIVSAGFWMMMKQLYQFNQPVYLLTEGLAHLIWLGTGVIVAVASMGSSMMLFMSLASIMPVHLYCIYRQISRREGKSRLDLAGSLTLAMGMSWGYSFLRLALASLSMTSMQSLFFCDCWKTMGVVMLADKMRVGIDQSAKPLRMTDQVLSQMVPLVLGAGYIAALLWAVALPNFGAWLPMRIFATVLVSACPCVITLAEPLVAFIDDRMSKLAKNIVKKKPDWQHHVCVRRNFMLVKAYYLLSMVLSCGGSYMLGGFWMSPWTAGLLMLCGQMLIAGHTVFHVFGIYATTAQLSRWAMLKSLLSHAQFHPRAIYGVFVGLPEQIRSHYHPDEKSSQVFKVRHNSAGNKKKGGSCCANNGACGGYKAGQHENNKPIAATSPGSTAIQTSEQQGAGMFDGHNESSDQERAGTIDVRTSCHEARSEVTGAEGGSVSAQGSYPVRRTDNPLSLKQGSATSKRLFSRSLFGSKRSKSVKDSKASKEKPKRLAGVRK